MRSTLGYKKIFLALILILQSLTINTAKAKDSINKIDFLEIANQAFVSDQLIIEYHKDNGFLSRLLGKTAQEEQDFFAKLNINYGIWNEASYEEQASILREKIRKFRKQGKLKKLKRAKKLKKTFKKAYAVLELDHSMTSSELKTLIKQMNLEKFASNNFKIDAVYPNYIYEISSNTNDPLNDKQFSHDTVKPEALWQYTRGKGVVVAVIDTGVDMDHEDLAANIWTNPGEIPNNGKDDDNNGFIDDIHGWDFVNSATSSCNSNEDCSREDNNPDDVNGHGTHVAGIIAAVADNNKGISGIAPEATIMPIRAGFSTGGSAFLKTDDIIEAITYAIDNNADIINMSFAGYGLNVLSSLLEQAKNQGIVSVAAAGNNSSNDPIYPAALNSVIAVGSTADGVSKSHFSNYGNWVNITAPGSWILSTVPNNGYDHKSGTSMSSPIVAGVAALLKAKNPNYSPNTIQSLIYDNATRTTFYVERGGGDYIGGVTAEIDFPFEIINADIPSQVRPEESVNLSATASESVSGYEWSSSIDGDLGSSQQITVTNLSLGTHQISVRALSLSGSWSPLYTKTMTVTRTQILTPNDNVGDGIEDSNQDDTDRVISTLNRKIRIKKNNDRFYASMSKQTRKQIKAFRWTSNIDGIVSYKRGFRKRKLSQGNHILNLEVQDRNGNWTNPLQRIALKFN